MILLFLMNKTSLSTKIPICRLW